MFLAGSFKILLIIALAVESQVGAFTIRRIEEPGATASDLEAAESSYQLHNVSPTEDVKVIDIKNDALQSIVPIDTTSKADDIQKGTEYETPGVTSTELLKISEGDTKSNSVHTTEGLISTTVSESTSEDETKEQSKNPGDTTEQSTSVLKNENKNSTESVTANITKDKSTTQETSSESTKVTKVEPSKDLNNDVLSSRPTEINDITSTVSGIDNKENFSTTNKPSVTVPNSTHEPESDTSQTITENSASDSKETEATTENKHTSDKPTETLAGEQSSAKSVPFWKKYTVIERKPVTSTKEDKVSTQQKDEEMVKEATAQSSIRLEKAFSISSDIPSLEKLKNDLLLNNPSSSENPNDIQSSSTEDVFRIITTESIESSDTVATTETSSESGNIGVVTSKRGGFLDNTSRATLEEVSASVEKNEPIKGNTTDNNGEVEDKKATASQMAEDAINEELMKEEISDNEDYAKRQREERLDISKTTSTEAVIISRFEGGGQTSLESVEDTLSVMPISGTEKKTLLYTVSPNYKPLRKLEVQPPKQFVRNPDDNSWRNESLNSLGIVFKAKNSSKPFTQVLKNKTETEWNSLLEKYNKGEAPEEPELRERLEKIAEMRKSKKKINKFGETVYTDYEEANTSNESPSTTSPKEDMPDSMIYPFAEISRISTTPPPTTLQPETTSITTTQGVYINRETITEVLETTTTEKPKKQSTIESYDADEEDADYVTLPNIDLKKYVTSAKSVGKQTITTINAPANPIVSHGHYLPDRKPTIQYFPPRVAPKVNVNDYDVGFQNKYNAYTAKDNVATIPPSYSRQKDKSAPNYAPPAVNYHQSINQAYPHDQETISENQYNGHANRGTYVIKHLKDFIEAARDEEPGYLTEAPPRGVAANALPRDKLKPPADYYDYEAQFRKDVLERFVDNFNHNTERFKVDFPILYNTSVVHGNLGHNGKAPASSSAFIKRLYDSERLSKHGGGYLHKPCDGNCDKTVELSPDYELHYYVPEEEEKQEVEFKHPALPYHYKL